MKDIIAVIYNFVLDKVTIFNIILQRQYSEEGQS